MEAARAALSALQEPDARMVEAGMRFRLAERSTDQTDTAALFREMIKAAQGGDQ
jgi:hypothetical protein